jgi:hypothetical protein
MERDVLPPVVPATTIVGKPTAMRDPLATRMEGGDTTAKLIFVWVDHDVVSHLVTGLTANDWGKMVRATMTMKSLVTLMEIEM